LGRLFAPGDTPGEIVSKLTAAAVEALADPGVRSHFADFGTEVLAIDWARAKNDRIYDGDGKKVEQHYAFGEDVLAVADGTIVSTHDGMPDETPLQAMIPKAKEDYGDNHLMLEIAPNVFALYAHLHPGSLTVKVGDAVKAGAALGRVGNTGPSNGPHLHFGLSNKPDFFAGRPASRYRVTLLVR
jgi:murein DD-endopeptidase MepM/ murein hydrolase activator NlpD